MKKQLFAGKFEIQGEISKGLTGTIYYGYDMGLRQEVAIKIYHSHINGRLIRGQAFIEKSKPLLLIDHPNLIKIFKVEEEDDTPVVFMEFFDAPSLQDMIHDKGPLPIQDMLLLAREITEVLVHTHFQGIIHGTLHPGHVLVGPQGQIKVMDLGLSWILMDILSNCDEELLRPLPYFPPEIAKGELLNVSSDLYCLGFMMYEMLTGTVPYAGLPKTSIMGKLAFDQSDPVFEFPETVPGAICDLIRHMTRNKTQQRLQDATHILTIINQQLPKLPMSQESSFSGPLSSQPKTPTPKDQPEPKNPSSTASASASESSTTAEPLLKKASLSQRPQKSMNSQRVKARRTYRKLGFLLGIVLLIAGGIMGYWYRGPIEQSVRTLSSDLNNSLPETSFPQPMPVEREILIAPAQDFMNSQESIVEATTDMLPDPGPPSAVPELQPVQEKSPLAPQINQARRGKSLLSITPQSELSPSPTPTEKPSSEIPSATSKVTPLPTKEALPIETESRQSATSATDKNQEPTDEEIEKLLQDLEAPATDPPLPTTP
jgi:serine/threonine protein kinase